jgi:hypothetical protein
VSSAGNVERHLWMEQSWEQQGAMLAACPSHRFAPLLSYLGPGLAGRWAAAAAKCSHSWAPGTPTA